MVDQASRVRCRRLLRELPGSVSPDGVTAMARSILDQIPAKRITLSVLDQFLNRQVIRPHDDDQGQESAAGSATFGQTPQMIAALLLLPQRAIIQQQRLPPSLHRSHLRLLPCCRFLNYRGIAKLTSFPIVLGIFHRPASTTVDSTNTARPWLFVGSQSWRILDPFTVRECTNQFRLGQKGRKFSRSRKWNLTR